MHKIFRALNLAIISVVLISILFAGWTAYTIISQTSKSSEINKVIKDMYQSEKSFFTDVVKLTKILVEDKSETIVYPTNMFQEQEEFVPEKSKGITVKEPLKSEDNGNNPLGIVIERFDETQHLSNEEIELPINRINIDKYPNLDP